jgi:uncharacterized phiE125 gp8 family phage protein
VSLETAKAHLGVTGTDEDTVVQDCIDAAVSEIDGPDGIGIAMIEQTWLLSLDAFEQEIRIPLGPVIDITSVGYVDQDGVEQTVDVASYEWRKGYQDARLRPRQGEAWPSARNEYGAVRVTFTAGFGAAEDNVEAAIRQAVLLKTESHYRMRGTERLLRGETVEGVGSRQYLSPEKYEQLLSDRSASLLRPYTRV